MKIKHFGQKNVTLKKISHGFRKKNQIKKSKIVNLINIQQYNHYDALKVKNKLL